jgi:hypothetical protein
MKTAMQELIERLEDEGIDVPFLIKSVYLEKEKEQVVDAFNEGIDEMAFATSGINYYNQTYNQNK